MFCVTTMRIARFLRDITVADGSADADAETQRFLRLAQEHNYWLATPEENAAVGWTASKRGDRRSAGGDTDPVALIAFGIPLIGARLVLALHSTPRPAVPQSEPAAG
jgi:hypothetical protein